MKLKDKQYRPGLPPMPRPIRALPVDERGYPVPFFVAKVDGKWDLRIMDRDKLEICVREKRCWVCGKPLGVPFTFVLGPMCCINRTSAEPPSHYGCADWSARACPFLTQREVKRNTHNLPENLGESPGIMLERQPGVVLLWTTRSYSVIDDGRGGDLMKVGPLFQPAVWLRQGRDATRAEVLASIESGLPDLLEVCETPEDFRALEEARLEAMPLLPAA